MRAGGRASRRKGRAERPRQAARPPPGLVVAAAATSSKKFREVQSGSARRLGKGWGRIPSDSAVRAGHSRHSRHSPQRRGRFSARPGGRMFVAGCVGAGRRADAIWRTGAIDVNSQPLVVRRPARAVRRAAPNQRPACSYDFALIPFNSDRGHTPHRRMRSLDDVRQPADRAGALMGRCGASGLLPRTKKTIH